MAATLTITSSNFSSNRYLQFSISISGLDPDFNGTRKIEFYLKNNNNYIYIDSSPYGSREITGDGNYYFEAAPSYLTVNNSYTGYFELIYKNANESTWTTALTAESSPAIKIPPNEFYFSSAIASGAETTTLTASAWRDFCDRINEFREYKDMNAYNFTYVSSGDEMTKAIMEQPWIAINAISGHGTLPSQPVQGETIYASYFHDLANALNAIQ